MCSFRRIKPMLDKKSGKFTTGGSGKKAGSPGYNKKFASERKFTK
jgi:hypothetical protein